MKKLVLLISFIAFLVACNDDPTDPDHFREKFLYSRDHVSNAWGYKHSGVMLENNGDVKKYDKPDNWFFPDDDGYISEEDLLSNYSKCTPNALSGIHHDSLELYYSYIPDFEKNELGESKVVGADMGKFTYYCYRWDDQKQKYKCIVIGIRGDSEQSNKSVYSQKMIDWLEALYMSNFID